MKRLKGINYGIHQDALIQTQTGEWRTILFVDSGPFGRFPSLQSVTWVDGWPMIRVNGKAVTTYKKRNVRKIYPITNLPTSDEFNEKALGMQWSWNHNPDSTKWSLTKKSRLFKIDDSSGTDDFKMACNTLTLRPFAKREQSIQPMLRGK